MSVELCRTRVSVELGADRAQLCKQGGSQLWPLLPYRCNVNNADNVNNIVSMDSRLKMKTMHLLYGEVKWTLLVLIIVQREVKNTNQAFKEGPIWEENNLYVGVAFLHNVLYMIITNLFSLKKASKRGSSKRYCHLCRMDTGQHWSKPNPSEIAFFRQNIFVFLEAGKGWLSHVGSAACCL